MRKIENIKTKLLAIPLLFLFYLIMYALNTSCIIKSILGFSCPGCGMTRAIISAMKLDFVTAFTFHSMFWSLPILILYFVYDGRLFNNRKLKSVVIKAIASGFLLNWIIRLAR